jgi:myo-inositol 2-dehydrogenase/D-chiro-inositol 1-dehydrogenase
VDHNHLDENYAVGTPDILDNTYVIVDFAPGQSAMLELFMFAEVPVIRKRHWWSARRA